MGPLSLPSYEEREIEPEVEEILFKITGHYLFPINFVLTI